MSDYIDRQAAIDAVMALMPSLTTADGSGQFDAEIYRAQDLFVDIGQVLNDLPPAEAEPVKRGKWEITEAYPHNVYCSVCHKRFAQTHWAVWEDGSLPRAYCPNCGAQMDAREARHEHEDPQDL